MILLDIAQLLFHLRTLPVAGVRLRCFEDRSEQFSMYHSLPEA
jgi:hypothetical protein